MPEKRTMAREGKHGATSRKQGIAIGLSKTMCAGVDLPPPKAGRTAKKRAAKKAARRRARSRPTTGRRARS